jgi:DNA mismatch repair ATPase MutS
MYKEMKLWEHRLRWMKMGSRITKFGSKEKIFFLYKIQDGISEKSYAINVAQIAGLPIEIIQSATRHLNSLEANKNN